MPGPENKSDFTMQSGMIFVTDQFSPPLPEKDDGFQAYRLWLINETQRLQSSQAVLLSKLGDLTEGLAEIKTNLAHIVPDVASLKSEVNTLKLELIELRTKYKNDRGWAGTVGGFLMGIVGALAVKYFS